MQRPSTLPGLLRAGLAMATPLGDRKGRTGMIIWCHGLGDSGRSWTSLPKTLDEDLPWLRWSFPDAPSQAVTCNGGEMARSWFDLRTISPVMPLESHAGLQESVGEVHKMVAQAEAFGFSRDRVVLGGFSQGACLALHAGLTLPGEPIAGIVAFSGWIGSGLTNAIVHPALPILLSQGSADKVVPLSAGEASLEALRSAGCSSIRHEWIDGLEHSTAPPQMHALTLFLLELLPKEIKLKPELLEVSRHQAWVDGQTCKVAIWLPSTAGVLLEVSSAGVRLSGAVQPAYVVAWAAPVDAKSARSRFVRRRCVLRLEAPVRDEVSKHTSA